MFRSRLYVLLFFLAASLGLYCLTPLPGSFPEADASAGKVDLERASGSISEPELPVD